MKLPVSYLNIYGIVLTCLKGLKIFNNLFEEEINSVNHFMNNGRHDCVKFYAVEFKFGEHLYTVFYINSFYFVFFLSKLINWYIISLTSNAANIFE